MGLKGSVGRSCCSENQGESNRKNMETETDIAILFSCGYNVSGGASIMESGHIRASKSGCQVSSRKHFLATFVRHQKNFHRGRKLAS